MSAGIGGFYSLGVLVAFVVGALFNWRILAGVSAALPLFGAMALLALPESPSWYIIKGRDADALASLSWLRGPAANVQGELEILRQSYSGTLKRQKESR